MKRIHKCIPTNKICTYFSMKKLMYKGYTDLKRLTWDRWAVKYSCWCHWLKARPWTGSLLFKEQRQKRQWTDSENCHVITDMSPPNSHTHFPRETSIYCLPTQGWSQPLQDIILNTAFRKYIVQIDDLWLGLNFHLVN